MADDPHTTIRDRLHRLATMPLGQVVVGCLGPSPVAGAGTSTATRLNVVIRGSKTVCLPIDGAARDCELATGDAHFSPANTWERQSWDRPHELLCIVPRPDYLRVSLHYVEPDMQHHCEYVHTNRRHTPAFLYVLRALEALAREPERTLPTGLLSTYIHLACEAVDAPDGERVDPVALRCAEIRRHIENTVHEGLTRDDVARHFGLSVSHVSQLFREGCGVSIGQFIVDCRMHLAEELLQETRMPIHQVAEHAGWGTTVHFIRAFRQRHGLSPARWRQATPASR
jgi:AraC-like DNA-binding protein